MRRFFCLLVLVGVMACGPSYQSLDQVNRYASEDHKILYGMLETLQRTLNDRDVDGWFALYADDAIITYKKNQPTPKKEVMDSVLQQDLSTWKFKITDIKIVSTAIDGDTARIKAILSMKTGGRTKPHPETYYFARIDGKWRITKETNP